MCKFGETRDIQLVVLLIKGHVVSEIAQCYYEHA